MSATPTSWGRGDLLIESSVHADKEVEGYYDQGLRVPDDITLMWTDDKFVEICSPVVAVAVIDRDIIAGATSVATLFRANVTGLAVRACTTM